MPGSTHCSQHMHHAATMQRRAQFRKGSLVHRLAGKHRQIYAVANLVIVSIGTVLFLFAEVIGEHSGQRLHSRHLFGHFGVAAADDQIGGFQLVQLLRTDLQRAGPAFPGDDLDKAALPVDHIIAAHLGGAPLQNGAMADVHAVFPECFLHNMCHIVIAEGAEILGLCPQPRSMNCDVYRIAAGEALLCIVVIVYYVIP